MQSLKAETVGDGSPIHDRGPVQQITGGKWVYPLDLRPEDIDIRDIALSLSKQCRFIGHTKEFYSVAQHSVIVSKIVSPENALWGLLHDAAEAYIGDISRPVKKCLQTVAPGALISLENGIEAAVAERFGLPWPMPAEVKHADIVAVFTEKRDLLHPTDLDWGRGPEPLQGKIIPWSWNIAFTKFMVRYHELTCCD